MKLPTGDPGQDDDEMTFDESIAAIRRVKKAARQATLPVGRYLRPGWPYGALMACFRGHIIAVLWTAAAVDAWLAANPVCERCAETEEATR